jgi:hypothetical protein
MGARLLSSALAVALAAALGPVAGCYASRERPVDAGPRPDAPGSMRCEDESLPPYAGPPCSDAVSACRDRCARDDEPCRDACLDEPCRQCVYGAIFPCANAAGCESVWQTFACCVEGVPGCETLRGFERTRCAPRCPMRFEPYADCIESTGPDCFLLAARTCHLR